MLNIINHLNQFVDSCNKGTSNKWHLLSTNVLKKKETVQRNNCKHKETILLQTFIKANINFQEGSICKRFLKKKKAENIFAFRFLPQPLLWKRSTKMWIWAICLPFSKSYTVAKIFQPFQMINWNYLVSLSLQSRLKWKGIRDWCWFDAEYKIKIANTFRTHSFQKFATNKRKNDPAAKMPWFLTNLEARYVKSVLTPPQPWIWCEGTPRRWRHGS